MKSVFVSFAYTDEDQTVVKERMTRIKELFDAAGVRMYCDLFDEEIQHLASWREFMVDALEKLKSYDQILFIITSPRRSEGMLMEAGAAYTMQKPMCVMQHESSKGQVNLPTICDAVYEWSNEAELDQAIKVYIKEHCHA